jgi:hypothetical protein
VVGAATIAPVGAYVSSLSVSAERCTNGTLAGAENDQGSVDARSW